MLNILLSLGYKLQIRIDLPTNISSTQEVSKTSIRLFFCQIAINLYSLLVTRVTLGSYVNDDKPLNYIIINSFSKFFSKKRYINIFFTGNGYSQYKNFSYSYTKLTSQIEHARFIMTKRIRTKIYSLIKYHA